MDRRGYRFEPPRPRRDYDDEDDDERTQQVPHPSGGGIYVSADSSRPNLAPIKTASSGHGHSMLYSSTHSSTQSSIPVLSSDIPTLQDYVPVYPIGNVAFSRPRRKDSEDDQPRVGIRSVGTSSIYGPPQGPPPNTADRPRMDYAKDSHLDHHELLESLTHMSIKPDPPSASSYPLNTADVPHNAPQNRRRPERIEKYRPPPGPPPGPTTVTRLTTDNTLARLEPDDLSGKIILHSETYVAVGGFSTIWLGRWTNPNYGSTTQTLALKAFSGSRLPHNSERFRVRVRRETRNWHKMRHPNILPLIGICNSPVQGIPDFPLLVSYFCKEGNVNDFLRKNPGTRRGTLISQISEGLTYLHEHGFVHGDLKGSNILIKDDGQACICDFGRTKLAGDEDYSKTLIGSAYWLAPELINNDDNLPLPVTCESDMWALGMVVIELYTGDRPFPNVRDYVVLQLVASGSTPRREDYRTVPSAVWQIISLCWARDPNERPTIRDFKTRILSATGGY